MCQKTSEALQLPDNGGVNKMKSLLKTFQEPLFKDSRNLTVKNELAGFQNGGE